VRQLAEIHRAASEANLSFLLIGGWAVCAHGYARLTEDLLRSRQRLKGLKQKFRRLSTCLRLNFTLFVSAANVGK